MSGQPERNDGQHAESVVAGERGPAALGRGTPLQSKIRNGLAAGVVLAVGGAFLGWYYLSLATSRAAPVTPPVAAVADVRLPPLGPAPAEPERPAIVDGPDDAAVDPGSIEPDAGEWPVSVAGEASAFDPGTSVEAGAPAPGESATMRRLGSPVRVLVAVTNAEPPIAPTGAERGDAGSDGSTGRPPAEGSGEGLGAMLRPTVTPAVVAGVLPDRRWLLPKGAFIDCTLETAIDSTLPGMTTCITATDVWSADGSVVLIERGSKLVGETRSGLAQGQRRVFVLWSEARTPEGVTVALDSPGTDELGRSGVTGEVDTHFWERFGAAMLISIVDAGAAAVVAAQGDGQGSVVIAPQGASDVLGEVLRSTVNIPPTVRVAQGSRVAVLVARDVSFARVYALRSR